MLCHQSLGFGYFFSTKAFEYDVLEIQKTVIFRRQPASNALNARNRKNKRERTDANVEFLAALSLAPRSQPWLPQANHGRRHTHCGRDGCPNSNLYHIESCTEAKILLLSQSLHGRRRPLHLSVAPYCHQSPVRRTAARKRPRLGNRSTFRGSITWHLGPRYRPVRPLENPWKRTS